MSAELKIKCLQAAANGENYPVCNTLVQNWRQDDPRFDELVRLAEKYHATKAG